MTTTIGRILRVLASALRRAWRRTLAVGLPPTASLPTGRSSELEELFRAATHLRAEDGLIPMSALRGLSAEDRAAVQRLGQAEARRMIRAWADAAGPRDPGGRADRGAVATEVTEPYRRPR